MGEQEVYRAIYEADADDLIKESERAAKSQKGLGAAMSRVAKQAKKASEKLTVFGKRLGEVSGRVIRFGAVATAAIGAIIGQSLRAAASVEEMSSRFKITFKDMSDQMEEWAADYAAQIGRSRFAMMRMAADYKVLLSAFGLQEEAAIKATKALVQQTSDWESALDVPISEVIAKITSGLAGEAEALRRIGVFVDGAATKNAALTEGYIQQGQELDQLTKVKTRLSIILKALPEFVGDAARTSQDLTNRWRDMSGALEELSVDLGRVFVEDAKKSIGAMTRMIRSTDGWIRRNEKLTNTIGKAGLGTAGFIISMGALGKTVAWVSSGLGVFANLIGTTALALTGWVAGIVVGSIAVTKLVRKLGEWSGALDVISAGYADMIIRFKKWTGAIREMTEEQDDALFSFGVRVAGIREAIKRLESRARKGVITWKQYGKAVDILDGIFRKTGKVTIKDLNRAMDEAVAITQRHAGAARQAALGWKSVSRAIRLAVVDLENAAERLQNQEIRWKRLNEAQKEFSRQTAEMIEELTPEEIFDPETFEASFEEIRKSVGRLLPEIRAGSMTALAQVSGLLKKLTEEGQEYAEAMGRAAAEAEADRFMLAADEATAAAEAEAKALEGIRGFIDSASAAAEIGMELAKESVEKSATTIKEQIDTLETRLLMLRKQMSDMPMSADAESAFEAWDKAIEKLQGIRALSVGIPLGGGGLPSGPGLGTPTLDRLSTAMSTQRGRSGGNVVNVNAPVSIRHAEPPRATAKLVAQEIRRSARRTWGGRT